jgi:hypothetical protein
MKNSQVEQARHALLMGNQSQARSILRQVLRQDRQNKDAWFLFAELAVNDIQRIYCLEQVLLLEPKNAKAQQWLQELRGGPSVGGTAEAPAHPDDLSVIDDTTPLPASSKLPGMEPIPPQVLPPAPEIKPAHEPLLGEKNCPYVGLEHDRESLAAFPNSRNSCYLMKPPKPISLPYQEAFCLSKNYVNCELLEKRKKRGSLLSVLMDKAEKGK